MTFASTKCLKNHNVFSLYKAVCIAYRIDELFRNNFIECRLNCFTILRTNTWELELPLLLQFEGKFADIFNELNLRERESGVQDTLRHPALERAVRGRREKGESHLVVAVHQPDEVTRGGVGARSDHLTAGTVVCPHNLPLGRSILVLHTLAAHGEGLTIVTFLGDVDEVSGGHQSSTTIAGNLIRS